VKPVVLLVATATRWLGTARIPRALAAAGFDVVLLTPRNSLAERSAYIRRIGYIPDDASPMQWLQAFAAMVRAASPRLVVPCDDMAFRLLQMVVLEPPDELRPEVQLQLAHLIRESLGDPAHYRTSVEKTALPAAAAAMGVRVPEHAVVADLAAAEAFAAAHGYPIVLKRDHSTAGEGVEIVERKSELGPAFAVLAKSAGEASATATSARLLIQVLIPGTIHYENTAAWNGSRIGGFAVERLEYSHVKGPATVIRCYHSPQIRDLSSRLVAGFRMTGLFATEYMIHRDTGDAYLLEINRRLSPGMHVGPRVGVDLCALLHAAMHGDASARRDPEAGTEWVNVHFPQEWLRDPASRYLREHPVDVPWDEPGLIEAMLAMRNE
jgi:predicted ATP-grasp superfamily ATP-dependent carboligase